VKEPPGHAVNELVATNEWPKYAFSHRLFSEKCRSLSRTDYKIAAIYWLSADTS
jgi:hypothetical protein